MSIFQKITLGLIGGWLVALVAIYLVPVPFIVLYAHLLSFLVGIILFIIAALTLIKARQKRISLVLMVGTAFLTWLVVTHGFQWGARAHFAVFRGWYEAKATEVLSVSDSEEQKRICGEACFVMSTQDRRVAFHYAHGFLSWVDIVYDASGGVMEQDWMKKKQINVYFISAKPLTGAWYLAQFGD